MVTTPILHGNHCKQGNHAVTRHVAHEDVTPTGVVTIISTVTIVAIVARQQRIVLPYSGNN